MIWSTAAIFGVVVAIFGGVCQNASVNPQDDRKIPSPPNAQHPPNYPKESTGLFESHLTYPLNPLNALLQALYHLRPLRSELYSNSSPAAAIEINNASDSLKRLFARMFASEGVALSALIEFEYLFSGNFSFVGDCGQIYDPFQIYAKLVNELAQQPSLQEMLELKISTVYEAAEYNFRNQRDSSMAAVTIIPTNNGDLTNSVNQLLAGSEKKMKLLNLDGPIGHLEIPAMETISIVNLPRLLTFRLNRSGDDSESPGSSPRSACIFNSSDEDQINFKVPEFYEINHTRYQLHAVICFYPQSGHFVTYSRLPAALPTSPDDYEGRNSEWYVFRDQFVKRIEGVDDVLAAAGRFGYMLFYGEESFMNAYNSIPIIPTSQTVLASMNAETLFNLRKTLQDSEMQKQRDALALLALQAETPEILQPQPQKPPSPSLNDHGLPEIPKKSSSPEPEVNQFLVPEISINAKAVVDDSDTKVTEQKLLLKAGTSEFIEYHDVDHYRPVLDLEFPHNNRRSLGLGGNPSNPSLAMKSKKNRLGRFERHSSSPYANGNHLQQQQQQQSMASKPDSPLIVDEIDILETIYRSMEPSRETSNYEDLFATEKKAKYLRDLHRAWSQDTGDKKTTFNFVNQDDLSESEYSPSSPIRRNYGMGDLQHAVFLHDDMFDPRFSGLSAASMATFDDQVKVKKSKVRFTRI